MISVIFSVIISLYLGGVSADEGGSSTWTDSNGRTYSMTIHSTHTPPPSGGGGNGGGNRDGGGGGDGSGGSRDGRSPGPRGHSNQGGGSRGGGSHHSLAQSNSHQSNPSPGEWGHDPYKVGPYNPVMHGHLSSERTERIAQLQRRYDAMPDYYGGPVNHKYLVRKQLEAERASQESERKYNEQMREFEISKAVYQRDMASYEKRLVIRSNFDTQNIYYPDEGECSDELRTRSLNIFHASEMMLQGFEYKSSHEQDLIFSKSRIIPLASQVLWDALSAEMANNLEERDLSFKVIDALLEVANSSLDVFTSLAPIASWGRDLYEAISGRHLIDGHKLNAMEIGTAVYGAFTGGFGSKIVKGMKLLKRIGLKPFDYRRVLNYTPFENRVAQAVANPIKTPHGKGVQNMSEEALMARFQVENGAPLYRVGKLGEGETSRAQFWALEHPLTTKGYKEKYGISAKVAEDIDFYQAAVIKDNAPFITRVAPPLNGNPGGAVEVVIEEGGAVMEAFSIIGKGAMK